MRSGSDEREHGVAVGLAVHRGSVCLVRGRLVVRWVLAIRRGGDENMNRLIARPNTMVVRSREGVSYYRGRTWGIKEDQLLCSTYSVGGIAAAQEVLPGRSESSIMGRAKRLGLSRSGTGKMRQWTGLDEIKLRRLWRNGTHDEIVIALPDRSWKSITSKARKLDLFRNFTVRRLLPKTDDPILAKIRARMIDRGFTSTDLQCVAGLKRGCTRSWFTGCAEPKLKNIIRAIEALGGELVIKWRD